MPLDHLAGLVEGGPVGLGELGPFFAARLVEQARHSGLGDVDDIVAAEAELPDPLQHHIVAGERVHVDLEGGDLPDVEIGRDHLPREAGLALQLQAGTIMLEELLERFHPLALLGGVEARVRRRRRRLGRRWGGVDPRRPQAVGEAEGAPLLRDRLGPLPGEDERLGPRQPAKPLGAGGALADGLGGATGRAEHRESGDEGTLAFGSPAIDPVDLERHRLEVEQVAESGEVARAGEAFGLAAVADDGEGLSRHDWNIARTYCSCKSYFHPIRIIVLAPRSGRARQAG